MAMCDIHPTLQNIVSTVQLGCSLDLRYIALHTTNVEYNPKRFSALIMRLRKPHTTALLFTTGKMVCTGAKTVESSKKAARRFARIIQKLGFAVTFRKFIIQNVVASCNVKFSIKLDELAAKHSQLVNYEAEIFPGLTYNMSDPKIILLIFTSGNVIFTGARTQNDILKAFEIIYPILKQFKR